MRFRIEDLKPGLVPILSLAGNPPPRPAPPFRQT
jgi:hypothetical protein